MPDSPILLGESRVGLFDTLHCRYPLPDLGVVDVEFQTKDTPSQFMDSYEIREDGTLWHLQWGELTPQTDRPHTNGPFRPPMERTNLRWEQQLLSGSLRFYSPSEEDGLEFQATYLDGQLTELARTQQGNEAQQVSLRLDAATFQRLRRLASAEACAECRSLLERRAEEAMKTGRPDLAASLLAVTEEIQALFPMHPTASHGLPSGRI